MSVCIYSSTCTGIDGILISVEVEITRGMPCFNIVGLADASVRESKERVRAAIINSGFEFPISRILVNLAPADRKKEGALLDLPIAIGILAASGQINYTDLNNFLFVGELSLSGTLKSVRGALPITINSTKNNINNIIVPLDNAEECSIIKLVNVYPFADLQQVINFLYYRDLLPYKNNNTEHHGLIKNSLNYSNIVGQQSVKRALEVSVAGGHNILMFGPPGCGKTMLAKCIPTIMPELEYDEAIEVTNIYSISGKIGKGVGLIKQRPFRNPHHTITKSALIGGGAKIMPGEITLANNGVLFLDEIIEFKKSTLELLRQPLEDRVIEISRTYEKVTYPSKFMLVGALNPCPCGYYGSNVKSCICNENSRLKYINKLSGPLLDRIDLFSYVNSLSFDEMKSRKSGESSETIRERVIKARKIQNDRYKNQIYNCNASASDDIILKYCNLNIKTTNIIKKVFNRFRLSARAYSKILKVCRTIADLEQRDNITENDIFEALNYRKFIDNKYI